MTKKLRARTPLISVVALLLIASLCAITKGDRDSNAYSIRTTNLSRQATDIGQNRLLTKKQYMGSRACATCHSSIYQSYSQTPMALGSGAVGENLVEGSFTHSPSSISYRVDREGTKAFISYERPGDPTMRGKQEVHYFIGSGQMVRGYLYSIDGFLYQSPISYYAQKKRWDVSPGFETDREMPNRPVDISCLYCHASELKPIYSTQNRFASPPFADGISCERCHGPGSEHIKGLGAMVNPAKLSPERRDSVCAQCHLTGEAIIQRSGKSLSMYRPGDDLWDYASYFVDEDKTKQGLKVVSHVEAIAQSVCKQRSGDRMSCLSCHNPHFVPSAQQRASYFREKCLSCHLKQSQTIFRKEHLAKNYDCISCHMPRTPSLDINHTTLTDHRILRKLVKLETHSTPERRLIQFGTKESHPRELGLAYAELALRNGDAFVRSEAFRLLAEVFPLYPKDPEVLTSLAYLYQGRGEFGRAVALYEAALKEDPQRAVAAVNLGVIYAASGQVDRAISLWQRALERNPGLTGAGFNLAVAVCAKGDRTRAYELLLKVLKFNPDMSQAKQMLRDLDHGHEQCHQ